MLDHHEVVTRALELPALPPTCARLMALAQSDEKDFGEIEEIVLYDPILTAKVLRLANSAIYGGTRTVGSVREAVVRVGADALLGIAMSSATRPLLKNDVSSYGLSTEDLWHHSVAAAIAASTIGMRRAGINPALSFTAALLHDIGKPILGPLFTTSMLEWCRAATVDGSKERFEAEMEILSTHHAEVSGLIAQHWQMPESIVKAVAAHHSTDVDSDPLVPIVYMANVVAHEIAGTRVSYPQRRRIQMIQDRLKLTNVELDRICKTTAGQLEEVLSLYS